MHPRLHPISVIVNLVLFAITVAAIVLFVAFSDLYTNIAVVIVTAAVVTIASVVITAIPIVMPVVVVPIVPVVLTATPIADATIPIPFIIITCSVSLSSTDRFNCKRRRIFTLHGRNKRTFPLVMWCRFRCHLLAT